MERGEKGRLKVVIPSWRSFRGQGGKNQAYIKKKGENLGKSCHARGKRVEHAPLRGWGGRERRELWNFRWGKEE